MEMILSWRHSGFNVHISEAIPACDKEALTRVARYIMRSPVVISRLTYHREAQQVRIKNVTLQAVMRSSWMYLILSPGFRYKSPTPMRELSYTTASTLTPQTGAVSNREGLIEKANGGVLFLDEITELSKRSQAKLLRVLDDGTVRRMGSCEQRSVDFKIISASNRDIDRMIEQGRLRKDLYYRISGREIHLIPLRERREDIEPLLSYYLDSREIGIELEAMDLISRYPWPGNVRELVNMVTGMESVERGGLIRLEDLPGKIQNASYGETGRMKRSGKVYFKQSGPEKKRDLITEALKRSSGNRAAAARELGIARMTLYRYLEQFSIS
jgi:DNA-binding NtrC family response regulator